ncbi:MAG: VOC family protein [Dehalococcoidia bacterium]
MLERIDHMVSVVPNLEAAASAYRRLGLSLTLRSEIAATGIANQVFFVGANPENFTYLELLEVTNPANAAATGRQAYIDATAAGGAMVGLVFGVESARSAAAALESKGLTAPVESLTRPDGSPLLDTATIDTRGAVPFRISVANYPETWSARYGRSKAAERFDHSFPLKRLDHLAAVAPDLEAATRFWSETLGVSVFGEIKTPALIIRQLKIGDAVFELLGPTSPDSPMASRPASLASMAAWEVTGSLDDAVTLARSRGFTPTDPEIGVIPGTRRSTIPATELAGTATQLIEYV